MVAQKLMTAGVLVAALAGCQAGDDNAIGVFSCTDGQHGASVTLIDQDKKAELTLTKEYAVSIRPYVLGNKTVYRDVADPAAIEALKAKARAYCSTGLQPK